MKKEPLWDLFCSKNAAMVNADSIKVTPAMLRKFFDATYDAAHKQGIEESNESFDKINSQFDSLIATIGKGVMTREEVENNY